MRIRKLPAAMALLTISQAVSVDCRAQTPPSFTNEQSGRGEAAYGEHCAQCHGADLTGGELAPPLLSERFVQRWAGRPLSSLFSLVRTTMPPGRTHVLPDSTVVEMLAYLLESYGGVPGTAELPKERAALERMLIPQKSALEPYLAGPGYRLAPGVSVPPWPLRPNPLQGLLQVTDELLEQPPAGSWISWRRTRNGDGFSPLEQITSVNVHRLRVAWTLALPPGPNEATPLVHGGVMFVHSYGDHVQALDAETGDELWHYSPDTPARSFSVHRNMALYLGNLYFATSDARLIAISARTGALVWETPIGDPSRNVSLATGGPLAANGVVMQGLTAPFAPGGAYVVGLDASTGKKLWQFNTIPRPWEPNGNSWNGLPLEKRTGGSVWTAGSFDSKTGLAFFGPAPTYDGDLLRQPVANPAMTSDALYTDSTIALDPKTGRLAWHYQHLPNDQWDLDWAFERHVIDLPIDGKTRRVVVTAGKQAIYDALDADTGKYEFSIDLGLQNIVTAIDPVSGAKTVDSRLILDGKNPVTVCPHVVGAKSWTPASYDPTIRVVYLPLTELCMDIIPGRRTLLQGVQLRPRPDSDGKYGRLQAIDLETRTTLWIQRQRAAQTTGVLATSGGVVFAGALDRFFTAYSARTGSALWRARLSDVPNAAPISYAVRGQQYVAVIVGSGYGQTETFLPLTPEIRQPAARSSAIWVFELGK